jgi:hypothetical protein
MTGIEPGDLKGERRTNECARRIPEELADARVAEDQMERAGDIAIERLKPERGLTGLEPEPLHVDPVRKALKFPPVIAAGVPRDDTGLRTAKCGEEREKRDADSDQHASEVLQTSRPSHPCRIDQQQRRQPHGRGIAAHHRRNRQRTDAERREQRTAGESGQRDQRRTNDRAQQRRREPLAPWSKSEIERTWWTQRGGGGMPERPAIPLGHQPPA